MITSEERAKSARATPTKKHVSLYVFGMTTV